MTDVDSLSVTYETRRNARVEDQPPKPSPWRRRLIVASVVVGTVAVLITAGIVWWTLTHVTTVRAQICAAVVSLSSEADARMVELLVRPAARL